MDMGECLLDVGATVADENAIHSKRARRYFVNVGCLVVFATPLRLRMFCSLCLRKILHV